MAKRPWSEARDLIWLLSRTDSTTVPEGPTGTRTVWKFFAESIREYADEFLDITEITTFNTTTLTIKEAVTIDSPPALEIESAYVRKPEGLQGGGQFSHSARIPIERWEYGYIRKKQLEDTATIDDEVPYGWAPVRRINSNTVWDIHLFPRMFPNITIELHYRSGVTPTYSGTAVGWDSLTDAEFFWVCQMAAAKLCLAIGRREDVPLILQGVPDAVLLRSEIALRESVPLKRQGEVKVG